MDGPLWQQRVAKLLAAMAGGSIVFGSSCASDIREQIVAGGLDFVYQTTADTLMASFPLPETVESMRQPSDGG